MRKFKLVSLFSGAGGLDLGFLWSGRFEILFANDISLPAMRTYSSNFSLKLSICENENIDAQAGIALTCDIEHVDLSPLKDADVDVILGGPPCQDFSIVRGPKRKGIEVRRGRLYSYFVKALTILQPKAFLFENVPGLVSSNNGLAYEYILKDFSDLNLRWEEVERGIGSKENVRSVEGYHIIHSRVLDLSHFGVPQMRRRLIIVGIRKDLVRNRESLEEIKSAFSGSLKESMGLFPKYPLTPIETFEGKRLDELDSEYKEIMKKWEGVWLDLNNENAWRWKSEIWDKLTFDIVQDYLLVNGAMPARKEEIEEALQQHEEILHELGYYGVPITTLKPIDGTNELLDEGPAIVERMKRIPFDENYEILRGTKWELNWNSFSHAYRRLHPLRPAYTVLAYGGGGTHGYHYQRDRTTLTLRERARLQTFPDSFLFSGSKTQIRAEIGEAVPPIAAKRLAQALANLLSYLY
jgi:DNA (cytosine-5)-methyltransferase 1